MEYKQQSPISPTGLTAQERRTAKRQHRAAVISATRALVFARDKGCRCCQRLSRPTDQMHEIVPRSLLRGTDPEDVFTLENCVRVCRQCHAQLTAHTIRAVSTGGVVEFRSW